MYEVWIHDFRKIEKKQLYLGHFVFLAFHSMAAGNVHALQAVLLLPSEHLSKVRRYASSRTPILALLGGLRSENEAGQLALCPPAAS
jgi:hypothetical protein